MKSFALLIFLLIRYVVAIGQDARQVSIFLKEFENATSDSARAEALWHASFNSAYTDARMGLNYAERALSFAQKIGDTKLVGDSENCIGLCFENSGKLDSAVTHYYKSINALNVAGFTCESGGVYANLGNALKKKGSINDALNSFTTSEEIQRNCPDIGYHASTLYAIGSCYNSLDNYARALQYFEQSLQMEIASGDIGKQGNVHNGMANAYLGMNDLTNAKNEYQLSLQCYNSVGNTYNVAYAYEGIAQLFDKQNSLDSAIVYCSRALKIFEELNVNFDIVFESVMLAEYLFRNDNGKEAEKLLLQNLPITYMESLPEDRMNMLDLLAKIAESNGKYENAYHYLKEAATLRDSLQLNTQKTEMALLAGKYETEKRDKQIALGQAENINNKAENEKQRQLKYFFLGGAILLALLVLVLISKFVQKQKSARELEEKNKIIDAEKQRAEKSERMKQQFLANMSHEIRTPMNAITGLSRLMLNNHYDQKTEEYIKAIHHSGENLNVILNDILDVSKMDAGKLSIENTPFHIRTELQNLEQIYLPKATAKNINLILKVADDIPTLVSGDNVRLSQVLGNLINNAIKFTEVGEVVLEVYIQAYPETSDDDKQTARTLSESSVMANKSLLHFNVRDTGIGIENNKMQKVFESFTQIQTGETRRSGGTGLGLTIAKNLVELMGGVLEVKSDFGIGSSFSFSLPWLMDVVKPELNSVHNSLKIYTNQLHILVAEDNDYNYLVTHDTLLLYLPNAKIYRAHHGKEVLQFLAEDDCDLIFMDIQMPLMDGYETTREIRKFNTLLPIIGLTASVIRSDLEKCVEAGMNSYVTKPFNDRDLLDSVNAVLPLTGAKENISPTKLESVPLLKSRFLEMMPPQLLLLKETLRDKNLPHLKLCVHNMRPQLIRSNLIDLEKNCAFIEHQLDWNQQIEQEGLELVSGIELQMSQLK